MSFSAYVLQSCACAPPSPLNPRRADVPAGTLFYPVPASARVFIHPAGPRSKHGPIRRILFDPPIPAHVIGSPAVPFVVSDDHYAETIPRVVDKGAFKADASRTVEQMAEDMLLADSNL